MNRTLPCGCAWRGNRATVCPTADALQTAVEAAHALGNVVLVQETEQALVAHWRAGGLTRRDFDALVRRLP